MNDLPAPHTRVLLVSGVSGAGKSSALKQLDDLGFEAVDNMPLSLVARLVLGGDGTDAAGTPLAIGVDIRTRDFDASNFLDLLDQLAAAPDIEVSLLFIDCDDEVTRRHFEGNPAPSSARDRSSGAGWASP